MNRSNKNVAYCLAALVMLLLTLPMLPVAPTYSQANSRLFPETGKTVKGIFLKYWNEHGALAQQGFPISEEMQEVSDTDGKSYNVQYFERAVFEYHPEEKPEFQVLLSLLGTFFYQAKYGTTGAPNQTPNNEAGSVLVPETGKRLGGMFLKYWQEHGGLAQQGYPISDEFQELSDLNGKTYKVQYFQRAVFEYHPEEKPEFQVLLSQLGTFQYKKKYLQPTAVPTTPTPAAQPTAGQPSPTPGFSSDVVDFVWKARGIGDNAMKNVPGIAVDDGGNIYIVDGGNSRIQKLDKDGKFIMMWGSKGSGDGQFDFLGTDPSHNGLAFGGIAIDSNANIYVAESGNHRVQKFDATGRFLLKWGTLGTNDGEFNSPIDLAVDSENNVYVINDRGLAIRIQKFDSTGRFLLKIGRQGAGDGELLNPGGIGIDKSDNVYIADFGHHRIQKFNKDGLFLLKWGTEGLGNGDFREPLDVAVDSQGNTYVTEALGHRIQKFAGDGRYIGKWGSEFGTDPGQFNRVGYVAVDAQGNIYVTELGTNGNVQKFHPK